MFRNRFDLFLLSRLLNGRDWIRRTRTHCLHRCKCVLSRDLYFFPIFNQNDFLPCWSGLLFVDLFPVCIVVIFDIVLLVVTMQNTIIPWNGWVSTPVIQLVLLFAGCWHVFCFPRLFHLQRLKHKSPCSHFLWSGYMSLFTSFPLNCPKYPPSACVQLYCLNKQIYLP